jgi:hypothetical protein
MSVDHSLEGSEQYQPSDNHFDGWGDQADDSGWDLPEDPPELQVRPKVHFIYTINLTYMPFICVFCPLLHFAIFLTAMAPRFVIFYGLILASNTVVAQKPKDHFRHCRRIKRKKERRRRRKAPRTTSQFVFSSLYFSFRTTNIDIQD